MPATKVLMSSALAGGLARAPTLDPLDKCFTAENAPLWVFWITPEKPIKLRYAVSAMR